MADRVSSTHPSVESFRATVERSGGMRRPRLRLPPEAAAAVPTGVLRIDLEGRRYHATVRAGGSAEGPIILATYDNARVARSPGEGENRLRAWLDEVGIDVGRSVPVDVVIPEHLIGARVHGTDRVYEIIEPPSPALSDIAEGLDG